MTLKPTQSALWLRPPVPPERRNAFLSRLQYRLWPARASDTTRLIGRMVSRAGLMTIVAFVIIAVAGWGLARVPTGFLPIEDQGYLLVAVQLPDGAALERTQAGARSGLGDRAQGSRRRSGAHHRRHFGARQQCDAGQCRRRLCGAQGLERARQICSRFTAGCRRRSPTSTRAFWCCRRRRSRASATPAASPCRSNCATAARISPSCRASPTRSSPMRSRRAQCSASRPRSAPWRRNCESRSIASRRRRCMSRSIRCLRRSRPIWARLTSVQFNKFGRVFQVYAQADAPFRLRPRDIENLSVRNQQGDMIPLGTLAAISPTVGAPLISLYNLYPSSSIIGLPAPGFSSGEAIRLMEQDAERTLPPRHRHRMDRDVLSGEGRRQSDVFRVRDGDAAGLSGAGRPIRELVRAARGDPLGAAGAGRPGAGADVAAASTTISTPRSASSC